MTELGNRLHNAIAMRSDAVNDEFRSSRIDEESAMKERGDVGGEQGSR